MQKKLAITVDEQVYEGGYRVVGAGRISQFIEKLVRPLSFPTNLSMLTLTPASTSDSTNLARSSRL